MKFTKTGEVAVDISAHGDEIVFSIRDTGIGIAKDQQALIFEAFRQADGTTNRRFGGTGLGLSISRELARMLGGDVFVASQPEKGSTFTLRLPAKYAGPSVARTTPKPPPVVVASEKIPDANGDAVVPTNRSVLIVEDDPAFADILVDVAREAGFDSMVAPTAMRGFELAKKHAPIGILLDMKLPDHSGLSLLDRLKRDTRTRHVPVHVVSALDQTREALSMGAAGYWMKPATREKLVEAFSEIENQTTHAERRVLVVEDDSTLRESIATLLKTDSVEIDTASTVAEALDLLGKRTYDCVVTDLALPDKSGFELLETMTAEERYSVPPVIVYTGRPLTAEDETRLRKYSKSIIVKGTRSPERLLDEVTLFLHQVESELPADKQRLLKEARHHETVFEGRNILIAEDDVRNVFALTSVLEPHGATVTVARNGKEALAALERTPIDCVVMDIMMPEMDGLEAMRRIRKNPKWEHLPIIALTAKAMPDDQARCLAAGASDYLAKPLDVEMLLSLLRVWMPKH